MFVDRAGRLGLLAFAAYVVCVPVLAVVFPDAHLVRVLACMCGLVLVGGSMHVLLGAVVRVNLVHVAALGLVVVGCVSALFAPYADPRWWGIGFELGTVGSLLLFATGLFVGSSMRHDSARLIPLGLVAVGVIVSLCVVGIVAFGIEAGVLSAQWPVLAIALSVALTILGHFVDAVPGTRKLYGIPLAGILAIGAWCLAHPAAWYVILAGTLCAFALLVRANTRPLFTAAVFVFGVIGLLYASHAPLIPATPDIRPTVDASLNVIVPALFERASGVVFGAGPNGFSAAWDRYRPLGVNATPLWNMSFTEAHSSLLTILAMVGVVGFAAFAFIVAASLYRGVLERKTNQLLIVAVVALIAALCVFPVGVALFVLLGLCLGVMAPRDGGDVMLGVFGRRGVATVLFLLGCSVCYAASAQTIAAVYASRAADLPDSQQSAAVDMYARAVWYWPAPSYERDYAYALAHRINETLVLAKDEARLDSAFAQDVALAVDFINKSVTPGIRNYPLWIDRAALFITLARLGITESEIEAHVSLDKAAVLAPTSPTVPFMRALLEQAAGDRYEARVQVERALALKPDYTEALSLRAELLVSP